MRSKHSNELRIFLEVLKGNTPSHLDGLDINALYDLFQRHRLFTVASPLLGLLDEKNREKWKKTIRSRALRSMHQTSVLHRIMNAYKEAGIEVIPLKGPVLAQSLYGDVGRRHFSDLDLLIRGVKVDRMVEVTEAMGFIQTAPEPGLSPLQWDHYFMYKKEIIMEHREERVFLELHLGIDNHQLLNHPEAELLWKDLKEQKVGESIFPCFSHENTFLYLVFHGAMHLYFRLFWLRDVAEALRCWPLDHAYIIEQSKAMGMERLLGVSLELAADFFGSHIPAEYAGFREGDEKTIRRLVGRCKKRIEGAENLTLRGKLNRQSYIFRLRPEREYRSALIRGILHRWRIRKILGGH